MLLSLTRYPSERALLKDQQPAVVRRTQVSLHLTLGRLHPENVENAASVSAQQRAIGR